MSETPRPAVLCVDVEAQDPAAFAAYMAWLEERHVQDVFDEGATHFRVLKMVSSGDGSRVVGRAMVTFPSLEALEHYVHTAAPALRAQGAALLKDRVTFTRATAELVLDQHLTVYDKSARYEETYTSLKHVLEGQNLPFDSRMSSLIALLKQNFPACSWVGYYACDQEDLVVRMYQGPLACTRIAKGQGVCGTAWAKAQAVIVPDVEAFEGHIACDGLTRSEIVMPVISSQGEVLGVLDLDSHQLAAFDDVDNQELTRLLHLVVSG